MRGPVPGGVHPPGLVPGGRGGEITDHRITDPEIMAQVRELGPESFPTRQLQSFYLGWFCVADRRTSGGEHARRNPPETVHLGHGLRARPPGGATPGEIITTDAVVYTVGHTDSMGSNTQLIRERLAKLPRRLLRPPAYTNDVDYSAVRPGDRVIVTGMGLAFIDSMVLYEGREGRFETTGERVDGANPAREFATAGPLTYVACGQEPHVFVGSRRMFLSQQDHIGALSG